jgi:hypothetical protein
MIVAFDNTFRSLPFNSNNLPTPNYEAGVAAEFSKERVECLIGDLSCGGGVLIAPSPCLAEMLSAAPDVAPAIEMIDRSVAIEVYPFDARCAIELAYVDRRAITSGDKRSGV